jgi:hypothetical protein
VLNIEDVVVHDCGCSISKTSRRVESHHLKFNIGAKQSRNGIHRQNNPQPPPVLRLRVADVMIGCGSMTARRR